VNGDPDSCQIRSRDSTKFPLFAIRSQNLAKRRKRCIVEKLMSRLLRISYGGAAL